MKIVHLKIRYIGFFIAILLFTWIIEPAAAPCRAREQESMGQLKLEGEGIQKLVLNRKPGQTETFDKPGEIINLPVGEYRIQQVDLSGGYTYRAVNLTGQDWIKVAEDKPGVLKIGAPLKQAVEVERRGRVLVLDYKLLGIGGENYRGGNREKPPGFTVYKGKQIIDSGQFQYG